MRGIETGIAGVAVARDGRADTVASPAEGDPAAWLAVGLDQDATTMGTLLRDRKSVV